MASSLIKKPTFASYTIESFSKSTSANEELYIEISPPSGYSKGVFLGFTGSESWVYITLIGISAGEDYPNRVHLKSSRAQTVTVKILFFR